MEAHQYPVHLTWQTGRLGEMTSPTADGSLPVATPPQFPGGVENVWSPEHYFTAAVVSCFMTTFLAVAELSKFPIVDFSCDSSGTLDKVDGKFLMSRVVLRPQLVIDNEADTEKALRLLEKAERACLITNSIKSEVMLEAHVMVAERV